MTRLLFLFSALFLLPLIGSAQELPPPDTTAVADTSLFTKVEVDAEFPGGLDAWRVYLMKHLDTEAAGRDVPRTKNFRQTAIVRFLIDRDGTVLSANVSNEVLPSIRKEAIRVILGSGKWIPARANGRTVKAYRTQPITLVFN